MLVPGWCPAEETEPDPKALADGELARLPPALAAFHRLARLRPTPHRFSNPVLLRPRHVRRPHGGQLVFAADNQGVRDWSIPWPLRGGPTDSGHPFAHVVGEVVEGLPSSRLSAGHPVREDQEESDHSHYCATYPDYLDAATTRFRRSITTEFE
ncbi:hypothetical protein C1708_28365 [Streptomyces sp. DH-12]|nr:hypothetical protein C1708_28365 [Streptomyces sp. DH-12]